MVTRVAEDTVWEKASFQSTGQKRLYGETASIAPKGSQQRLLPRTLDPMQAAVDHFVDCVITGRKPSIDVRDGAKTVSALVAGVESAESGAAVTVSNEF